MRHRPIGRKPTRKSVYKLRVTDSVIRQAKCGDPRLCALAIAGKEQTPLQNWQVNGDYIMAKDPQFGVWLVWRLPAAAYVAMEKFDDGDRSTKFPTVTLPVEEAIYMPSYYSQGRNAINLRTMSVGEVTRRAAKQMIEFKGGERDYLAQRKRIRNNRAKDPNHVPQPRTEAQKRRDRCNMRFGSQAAWAIQDGAAEVAPSGRYPRPLSGV